MLTFRSVQKTDLMIISQFPQTPSELYYCFPSADFPLTVDQLEKSIESRRNPTIIENEGQIVGFADFYQWAYQGCCKIGHVMVSPIMRHQGIAKYLLSVMEAQAKDCYDATTLQVSCFNTNTIALLFYDKIGFKPISIDVRTDKCNQKHALIHLRKIL